MSHRVRAISPQSSIATNEKWLPWPMQRATHGQSWSIQRIRPPHSLLYAARGGRRISERSQKPSGTVWPGGRRSTAAQKLAACSGSAPGMRPGSLHWTCAYATQ